jgi:PBP1b-binding outer membrane lipoprotein LpoB
MQHNKIFIFSVTMFAIFLNSCSEMRESAGVTRKSIDEFQTIENPPLIIPPDFNLVNPDQLQQKNIEDVEKELAKEILFGLDETEQNTEKQLSTMNEILSQANATDVSNDIREEFDQEFAQEKKTDSSFQIDWDNEEEVLDAVKESERIRDKNFKGEKISEGEVSTKTEKIKVKKKKRFFFF